MLHVAQLETAQTCLVQLQALKFCFGRHHKIVLSLCNKFHKQKTCSVFLSSYRNTSGSLREREMLWEHEP